MGYNRKIGEGPLGEEKLVWAQKCGRSKGWEIVHAPCFLCWSSHSARAVTAQDGLTENIPGWPGLTCPQYAIYRLLSVCFDVFVLERTPINSMQTSHSAQHTWLIEKVKVVFRWSRALPGGSPLRFCKPRGRPGPEARTHLGDGRRLELSKNCNSLKGNQLPVPGDIKAETKCHQGHERKFLLCVGNSQGLFSKVCTQKTQRARPLANFL